MIPKKNYTHYEAEHEAPPGWYLAELPGGASTIVAISEKSDSESFLEPRLHCFCSEKPERIEHATRFKSFWGPFEDGDILRKPIDVPAPKDRPIASTGDLVGRIHETLEHLRIVEEAFGLPAVCAGDLVDGYSEEDLIFGRLQARFESARELFESAVQEIPGFGEAREDAL